MKRRELRVNTFIMLYLNEFHQKEDMEEQYSLFIEKLSMLSEDENKYVHDKVFDIISKLDILDKTISDSTIGWSIDRMSKVDLSILRLACYEILYEEDIPELVSVDEAVEIAKLYGGDSSPSFINGVLAKIIKK